MTSPAESKAPPGRNPERKDKPLHKDPSFWIVAVILVGAANYAQFTFGFPWLQQQFRSMRTAPRMTNAPVAVSSPGAGRGGGPVFTSSEPQNLDTSPKTYPWQTARPNMQALQAAPAGTIIIPTEFSGISGGWTMGRPDVIAGTRVTLQTILMSAYQQQNRTRIQVPPDLPSAQFDFISKSPVGSAAALQEELKKKFGLVGTRETQQKDALVLKVERPDALKPLTPPFGPTTTSQDTITLRSVGNLVSIMEQILRTPVIDQTGLTESYDIQLPQTVFRGVNPGQPSDTLNQLKSVLLEKYGLQLVQTNTSIEILVVKEEKVAK